MNRPEFSHYKYLKVCETTVRVKIERGNEVHLKHFPIREFPSLSQAVVTALAWRDETHLKKYGIPVLEKVVQIKPRRKTHVHLNPVTAEKLPDLPAGLSYGYHRGRLLYVVASYQENNISKKARFAINGRDIDVCIREAREFRLGRLKNEQ